MRYKLGPKRIKSLYFIWKQNQKCRNLLSKNKLKCRTSGSDKTIDSKKYVTCSWDTYTCYIDLNGFYSNQHRQKIISTPVKTAEKRMIELYFTGISLNLLCCFVMIMLTYFTHSSNHLRHQTFMSALLAHYDYRPHVFQNSSSLCLVTENLKLESSARHSKNAALPVRSEIFYEFHDMLCI